MTQWWKSSKICLLVLTEYTNVTDRQTNRQADRRTDTAWRHRPCLCIASRGKNRHQHQYTRNTVSRPRHVWTSGAACRHITTLILTDAEWYTRTQLEVLQLCCQLWRWGWSEMEMSVDDVGRMRTQRMTTDIVVAPNKFASTLSHARLSLPVKLPPFKVLPLC